MKVLIKDLHSGLFIDRQGGWTARKEKVRDFGSAHAARHFREGHQHNRGTATVIRFAEPRHDIQLRDR